ncbi:MAG: anthranilate synthase component I family protein, partial [Legionellales bacterium]|nr:anthranilate synthase component I family protein [Legionellales bacterium]
PVNHAKAHALALHADTDFSAYQTAFNQIHRHIQLGDAFQVVLGRMFVGEFVGDPLQAYQQLSAINPAPYQFFMQDETHYLLGTSPELALRVEKSLVEIHPIAGTKPRGNTSALQQRYQIALQVDGKELAEHTMLIDLARNDIASIAIPGTTEVTQSFTIQTCSHVQHLVSVVTGKLNPHYDALTAYLATMNMGTLTGAPKPSALTLINRYEKNARGLFGGGFGVITHDGDLEMTIIIRALRIKHNQVYLRAASGIVADSIVEHEFQETEHKSRAGMSALGVN